jgi:hypothetical protein
MEYAYERRALIVVFITAIRDYKQEESTGKKYTVMNRVEASIAAKKNRQNRICVRRFKLTGNIL